MIRVQLLELARKTSRVGRCLFLLLTKRFGLLPGRVTLLDQRILFLLSGRRLARLDTGQLPKDLVPETGPEVRVGIGPGVEANLNDVAQIRITRGRAFADLVTQQTHERALARAPRTEQAHRQWRGCFSGRDDRGQHLGVHTDTQMIFA